MGELTRFEICSIAVVSINVEYVQRGPHLDCTAFHGGKFAGTDLLLG